MDQTILDLVLRATKNGDCDGVRAALAASNGDFEVESCTAALSDAIHNNQISDAATLLEHGLNLKTSYVRAAVHGRRLEMLQMFLDHGWEINRSLGRSTPPTLELTVEDETMVDWFLRHGADPDAACDSGGTPLSSAVECGQLSVIKMLLGHSGDASHGYLLHRAVYRTAPDRIDVVSLLIDHGAPVNQCCTKITSAST